MDNIVELKNISKIYGKTYKTVALDNVSLNFKDGSFSSIIGQSGSGKSTMLNILGTLDYASSGEVIIDGINTKEMSKKELSILRNQKISFIFQFHYLLPEFSAIENVLIPLRIRKNKITPEDKKRASDLLDLVGLEKVKNNMSTNMSGGQMQRVAIARALITSPKIILADEPTGNLDSDSTIVIYDLLRKINKETKTTIIVITHDRSVAEKTDRIIEIKDGKVIYDIDNM